MVREGGASYGFGALNESRWDTKMDTCQEVLNGRPSNNNPILGHNLSPHVKKRCCIQQATCAFCGSIGVLDHHLKRRNLKRKPAAWM